MGKLEQGEIRGAVGPTIFRKVGKRRILQAKAARKVKRTEASKNASAEFGRISHYAKLIRRTFFFLIRDFHDPDMIARLNGQLNRSVAIHRKHSQGEGKLPLGNVSRLVNFSFNNNSHLQDYLFVDPVVTFANQMLTISLPAFNYAEHLVEFGDASYCFIRIEAHAFDFHNNECTTLGEVVHPLDLRSSTKSVEANEWQFDVNVPSEQVILVGMCLEYHKTIDRFYLINDKQRHPVGIIGAFIT